MYVKKYFLTSLVILMAFLIGACVPSGQQSLKVTIDGIENNQRYESLPDFSLDYSSSANTAQQAGAYDAFKVDLKNVQVLLNGQDVSSAMTFNQKYASINDDERIFSALQLGKNNLIIQKKADATSSSKQLDSVAFYYEASGTNAYISDVSVSGSQMVVSGYAISSSPISSVTLNDNQATVIDKRFTVRVAKSSNYTLVVEDVAGKKAIKHYAADTYIRNAMRVRIEDDFLNQPALRNQIVNQLGGSIQLPTNQINPVVDFSVPLLARVQASIQNPINLGSLELRDINFSPSTQNAAFDTGMVLRNSQITLSTYIRAGLLTFNLTTIAKLSSVNIDIDGEFKSSNNKLVSNIKSVDVNPAGLSIEVQGLPRFLNAIITPFSNAVMPVFKGLIDTIMLTVMNDVFDQLVSDINLSSVSSNETSHVDSRIVALSSDTKNMYIDMQMGIATVKKTKQSIGALSTARAASFNTSNKTSPFSAYTTALSANTQKPQSTQNRNVGVAIASDVVNQQMLSSFESGEFVMRAYMVNGELSVQDNEPANVSNLDLRLSMEFTAPLELGFNGSEQALNAQVVVPTFRVFIEVYQGGRWNSAGTLDATMSIPGQVIVSNKDARLLVNESAVELKKLNFDATNILVQLFESTLDKALQDMKPELADMVEEMSIVELNFPGSSGVSNVQAHVNSDQHIGIDMHANFVKIFQ